MMVLRGVLLASLVVLLQPHYSIVAKDIGGQDSNLSQQRLMNALKGQKKSSFDLWVSNFETDFKHLKTTEHLTAAGAYSHLGSLRDSILSLPQSSFTKKELNSIIPHLEELRAFLDCKIAIAREDLGTTSESFLWTPHAKTIQLQRDIFSILHAGDQEGDMHAEDEPVKIANRLERVLEFSGRHSDAKETVDAKAIAFNFEQALIYFKAGYWITKDGAIEFAQAFCRLVKAVADLNDNNRELLMGQSEKGLDPIARFFIPDQESGREAHQYSVAQKLVYAYALLNAGYNRSDLINAAFDLQLNFQYPVVKKFAPTFLRLTSQKLLHKDYVLGMTFADELFARLDSFIHPFGAHGLDGAALAIEFKIVIQDIDGTVSKLGYGKLQSPNNSTFNKTFASAQKYVSRLWQGAKRLFMKLF